MAKIFVLSPVKRNAYAPMFRGTLEQAIEKAKELAAHLKSRVLIFDGTRGRADLDFIVNVDPEAAALGNSPSEDDKEYTRGWDAGLKMLRANPEQAFQWWRDYQDRTGGAGTWFEMGKSDVISEHWVARHQ